MARIDLSLIIPIYNEQEIIGDLFSRCMAAAKKITDHFEIISVDDGSIDGSLQRLVDCHRTDRRFKVLVLSRNFGHQAAYTAGLSYARGEFVAMMDGDLQDTPELLPEMHRKLTAENLDVVYGRRTDRAESWLKRLLIGVFHRVFNKLSGGIDEDSGNFSIFNRKVLKALLSFRERNRYLPGLRTFVGFRQDYIEYSRPDRDSGRSGMGFGKLVNLAMDAIFSFSDIPIKICLYLGLAGVVTFFAGTTYSVVSKWIGIAPFGWTSTVMSIYFFGSVQLLFLGIIGEYVFRIYRESQKRPIYIVNEYISGTDTD